MGAGAAEIEAGKRRERAEKPWAGRSDQSDGGRRSPWKNMPPVRPKRAFQIAAE